MLKGFQISYFCLDLPFDVCFGEVLMNRRHVDAIESLGLLSQSLDDGLRLRHVARSTHLQHARQAHETPPTVIYVLLAVATADS